MKLTSYEEKILKYLIENYKNNNEGIEIPKNICEPSFACDAIEELEKYGLVKSCIAFNYIGATLTEKGYVYFDELKKEEYGEFYDSIKMIDELINKVEGILKSPNKEGTLEVINILTSCFWKDIPKESFAYFNTYKSNGLNNKSKQVQDLELCKLHLRKLKGNLLVKAKEMKEEHLKVVNQIQMSQSQSTDISIDITNSMDVIANSSEFSSEEKVELMSLLNDLKKEKNDSNKKGKIRKILEKIIDKGVDVVIACAPAMIQALSSLK